MTRVPGRLMAAPLLSALLLAFAPAWASVQPATDDVRESEADHSESVAHPLSFTRHYRSAGNLASGLDRAGRTTGNSGPHPAATYEG